MKEKKKKQGRRLSTHAEIRRYTGLPKCTRKLSAIGLLQIKLSTYAQRAVNCVVGVDLTLEYPWVYINKEKVEDNLELHAESSDFLPLMEQILSFPDSKLLVCLKREREKDEEEDVFFICTTMEVKNVILILLKENHLKINNAVIKSMLRYVGVWQTLGSEVEIFEETVENFRPLLAVEIECEFPIFKGRRKFSLSLVYPESIQFVECLARKRIKELVYKRRMTTSVQSAPLLSASANQTMDICQMDRYTQYEYEIKEIQFCFYKYKRLLFFLNQSMNIISDSLLSNAHINIYINDYKLLSPKRKRTTVYNQTALTYFRDINYSRNKYVSALVWHPRISGLVAVAYAHKSRNLIRKDNKIFKRLEFMENVVLIWCYSFCVKPKLILHADREIASLCFCPYNVDILIGGCTNGQIIIWDLTNKLQEVEKPDIMLTLVEEKHRVIVESHTKWMKLNEDVLHIEPTAISDILNGHRSAVSSISWISSNFECTKTGNIESTKEPSKPFIGGQFITCGLDGLVYIWDLHRKREIIKTIKYHKVHLPMFQESSVFRQLNNTFYPLFKIIIESPYSFLPLTNLLISNQKFIYEAINPETAKSTFTRTYFRSVKSENPKQFIQKLNVITNIGTMFSCTWNGCDYDQGNPINYAIAENVTFMSWVHDAPIHTCNINPLDNNILLTVGGKIFAIWNNEVDTKALVWRKNCVRYSSGLWSVNNIGIVIMFRVDSKIELWDILVDSKDPARIIDQTGLPTIDTFLDCRAYHLTKETYFKTNREGNLVLTSLMSKQEDRLIKNKHNISLLQDFGRRIITRRHIFNKWLHDWKEKHLQPPETFDVNEHDVVINAENLIEQKKTEVVTNVDDKWKKKDYQKKLLNLISCNNKLDLGEIAKNKHLVMSKIERKNKFENKLKQVLKGSGQIFESNKKNLLESYTTVKRRRKSFYCSGKGNELKEMYIQSYYQIEKDVLPNIQKKSFEPDLILPYLIEKRQSKLQHLGDYGDREMVRASKTFSIRDYSI